ncbi:MAG: hypothetical protein ACM3TU_03850 [Bacillota bacterium]
MSNVLARIKLAGMWDPYTLPTRHVIDVLEHLNRPETNARLYVQYNGNYAWRGHLTEPHRYTRIDLERVIKEKWVIEDEEQTREEGCSIIRVFIIGPQGKEAIAQYHARRLFLDRVDILARATLRAARGAAGARLC